LICSKLKQLGIGYDTIGSNLCNHTKKDLSKCRKNLPVIIASATKQHLDDVKLCLDLNPSRIYVEKGFYTVEEYALAKELVGDIPLYILSQYRYSAIFKFLEFKGIDKFNQIDYNWEIEKGEISEWCYHIISLNNFLRKNNNRMIVREEGTYRIDESSDFVIKRSENRNLVIYLQTDSYEIKITLGKSNILEYTEDKDNRKIEFQNEDCLLKQLQEIFIFKNNKVLERL